MKGANSERANSGQGARPLLKGARSGEGSILGRFHQLMSMPSTRDSRALEWQTLLLQQG